MDCYKISESKFDTDETGLWVSDEPTDQHKRDSQDPGAVQPYRAGL